MAYVIKRYSNRKLYDTQESRYVTLEEIEEMIRAGREISVVDAGSGEDLTSVTLTQIILENERTRRASLPAAFLHQLIKHGESWQEAPRDPLAWYQRALTEGVENAQKWFRILEGNAQAVTRTAERLSTTAEQTGKGIQESFSEAVTKLKDVYAA